jgi:hypothetical protein
MTLFVTSAITEPSQFEAKKTVESHRTDAIEHVSFYRTLATPLDERTV